MSAHSLAYSHDFTVLLSAAYEEYVIVWAFDVNDSYMAG